MTNTLPFYQIDAFASRPFTGNQACVMPLPDFLPDATLQAIAAENNVAETAFVVPSGEGVWRLRWFTPTVEVPLCGHATLAAAHALWAHEGYAGAQIAFDTVQSGRLSVTREGDTLVMDFPAPAIAPIAPDEALASALGQWPLKVWTGPFLAAMLASPQDVIALRPDLTLLKRIGAGGAWGLGNVGVFARGGDGVDVTSRFFAPGSGIDEDPATGSWHCMLAAVMADLGESGHLACHQTFPGRGAHIGAKLRGDRVALSGHAVTVISGQFHL
jgi:PhzF family phenazine biosynthesis protein